MFFGNTTQDTRNFFYTSWRKYRLGQGLSPLEEQLVAVILAHPEYHVLLEDERLRWEELSPDSNPFLHMGLHLAIRDQIAIDNPCGIKSIYQKLMNKHRLTLEVEHLMMDCLAKILWQAQSTQSPPNEKIYLQALRQID